MSTYELLSTLERLGVRVWVEGEGVRYSAPKGALTPDLLARIRERKADIIAMLGKASRSQAASVPAIRPAPRDGRLPLSFAQQRLWFLCQLQGGGAAYNIPLTWAVNGPLDVLALERALGEIVRRHEALRTRFGVEDGEAYQTVAPPSGFALSVVDLEGLEPEARGAEARRRVYENTGGSFDLGGEPLLRALLLRLGPDSYVLSTVIHHIACDGWSVGVFFRELGALYEAYAAGAPSPLPELPVQYPDFAAWQREWLRGEVLEKQLAYWRGQLAGAPPVLELETDRPRPTVQSFRGGMEQFEIPPALVEGIRSLAKQAGATPFAVLLAAFKVLLLRSTGREDLVVGSPIAGRNQKELEPLIGFFANTLVLRTDLGGHPTFREAVDRVRRVSMEAYAHQDVPFEKLVEELSPERDLARNPLAQVLFVLQNAFNPTATIPGVELGAWETEVSAVRFDFELHVWDTSPGQLGTFFFNADLFDAETVRRTAARFLTLLEGVVADPDMRVSEAPLLPDAERREILELSQGTPAGDAKPEPAHRLVEAWALKAPDAVAVSAAGAGLTYGELNRRADRLARVLRSRGAGPGAVVGLRPEPSTDAVVGLLAILKAGAAVLPLASESELPVAAETLLTLSPELEREPVPDGAGDGLPDVGAGDLACLLPSGRRLVAVEHEGLALRLEAIRCAVELGAAEAVVSGVPAGHHAWVWSLLWPLTQGACVRLEAEPRPGADMILGRASEPDTPRAVIRLDGPAPGSSDMGMLAVRSIGEAGAWAQPSGDERVYTVFAPPETAGIFVAGASGAMRPVGLRAYVLDDRSDLAPIKIAGCVFLGGPGLARGYRGDAAETDASFVADPFSSGAGALFAVGERGRLLPDGSILFAEPGPDHAWVAGARVAMADVEAAMLASGSIEECVVRAGRGEDGTVALVAYVVPVVGGSAEELEAFAKVALSPEMRPANVVALDAIPRDADGRADEAALARVELIDASLIARWEAALRSVPGVREAAVVVREHAHGSRPLHVARLLPASAIAAPPTVDEAARAGGDGAPGEFDDAPLALSDGGPLAIDPEAPATLTEALLATAARRADAGITFVLADGSERFQSYAELLEEAKRILTGLRAEGLGPGDRAVLQIGSLEDHFAAFWGCVLGGITPVTVAVAPSYDERNAVVNKLFNAWELLGRPRVIASDALAEAVRGLARILPMEGLSVLTVGALRRHEPAGEVHRARPEDVLFLQLTSGSTGVPKCIQITHRGVVHHVHGSERFNGYDGDDATLNWLPMDHVVPILTCHLKDVYMGLRQVAVATSVVLSDPLRWLDLVEKHRVTLTWSPNFGFKLVSDALAKAPGRRWDLSSVKYFMNAGEQVTLPVVREFLRLTAPFGVAEEAMQPAFGMAEACTCMTYRNAFDCETGVHRVRKSSLSGRLRIGGGDGRDSVEFVDLGGPVPGVQIRIADGQNRTVPERTIGRLQIKGAVVTPGYLNNDEANREAFVGDGWFNSGDLGFMLDGRLTLTGREKEIIIVNGANFYCYEIEDVVNAIEGVEPTYVAACGFQDAETGTEGLAIFFVPKSETAEPDVNLVRSIRTSVTQNLGISPACVVPIAKTAFPKTTSGKIQRTQLKKQLVAGEFRELLEEIDVLLESPATIPDWFYRKVWRRSEPAASYERGLRGPWLVFVDSGGLGAAACDELERRGETCIRVEAGRAFAELDAGRFAIDPGDPDHYRSLVDAAAAAGLRPRQVLHLWTCDEGRTDLAHGAESLLHLAQALARSRDRARLLVASTRTQRVRPVDRVEAEKTSVLGLVKTIPQEMPWIEAEHLDLEPLGAANAGLLLDELCRRSSGQEVAYRDGLRWSARLERVDFGARAAGPLPIEHGGLYLITGALGGVGARVAKLLLERFGARVLALGRTELPDRAAWDAVGDGALAERIAAYRELEAAGGELVYEAVDVCDAGRVRLALERAEARWGRQLDGVIHAAGVLHERMLEAETAEGLRAVLRPKVDGALALGRATEDRPGALFVSFSSVNGHFGGVGAGAYAAANSFLEGFAHAREARSPGRSFCIQWTMWEGLGMSRGSASEQLARARGYQPIPAEQGLRSLLVGLRFGLTQLLVGLDGARETIRRQVDDGSAGARSLVACFTAASDAPVEARVGELGVRDALGRRSSCELVRLESMPRTSTGEIDRARLLGADSRRAARARVMPRTEVEERLARIWRDVLRVPQVGVDDNFFELGGHSLLAVRLIARVRDELEVELPIDRVIGAPTVGGLAAWIEARRATGEALPARMPDSVLPLQSGGARRPFFVVHPASGSPLCYAALAALMGSDRPFYGFQSPALLRDCRPLDRLEEIAAGYVAAMLEVQPTGPYLIGGWSAGGPVAFEMARMLERRGERVELLALIDSGLMYSDLGAAGRSRANVRDAITGTAALVTFGRQLGLPRSYARLRAIAQMGGISLPPALREVLRRPLRAKWAFLKGLNAEIMRAVRMFQANTIAGLRYQPAAYGGKVTVFRTRQKRQPDPVLEDLRAFAAAVEHHEVPGNHMSIVLGEDVATLAESLVRCLAETDRASAGGEERSAETAGAAKSRASGLG